MERVVLVDETDCETGTEEKLAAHRSGLLHRAFSIFIFDASGRLLLQRRAAGKYHSGGLWSNACCGHPRPGEALEVAAHRRLREEMGFDCKLGELFTFRYSASLDHGLVENEIDHVLVGRHAGDPLPDPGEVMGWRRIAPEVLRATVSRTPEEFTAWFRGCIERVLTHSVC